MGSGASKGKEPPPGSFYPCCWSDLPLDLAGIVLLRLHAHADHVRFASVCRHWRHAAKLLHSPSSPPPLPWLSFRDDGTFERLTDGKRQVVRLEAYEQCRGSFDNWLLLEDVRAGHCQHYLKNPLTGDVVRLPGHCKEPVRRGCDADVNAHVVPPSSSTTFHLRKVVMCANGLVAAKITYHGLPDVVVFCWPGMSSWTAGICNGTWYHDIARYRGKMYAVSRRGDLYEHKLRRDTGTGEPKVTGVERVILAPLSAEGFPPEAVTTLDGPYAAFVCARKCYLVVSSRGKLLMVRWIVPYNVRDWADTMEFKVFEADLEMSRWVQLESLNDQVLFVSHDCCKAISASDHFRGDQIYFVDYGLEFWCHWPTCRNTSTCGVYDMRSNTISPVSPRVADQTKAAWFFPSVHQ